MTQFNWAPPNEQLAVAGDDSSRPFEVLVPALKVVLWIIEILAKLSKPSYLVVDACVIVFWTANAYMLLVKHPHFTAREIDSERFNGSIFTVTEPFARQVLNRTSAIAVSARVVKRPGAEGRRFERFMGESGTRWRMNMQNGELGKCFPATFYTFF